MFALFITGKSATTVLALLGYTAIGAATAARLTQLGQPVSTASAALAAWPLLLPLLGADVPSSDRGPFALRIEDSFRRLEEALGDPATDDLPWTAEIAALREALSSADRRLALADRLLGEETTDPEVARSRATLSLARDRAAAEIEAVLSSVAQLRLQVGLLALQGESLPVTERLRELAARAGALEEVTRL